MKIIKMLSAIKPWMVCLYAGLSLVTITTLVIWELIK